MENSRGSFGSKLGVILATAGSAVGLGNIWRFPYMTGQNGGAAFILIYLVCIFMLGIPGMVAEFIIGRHSAANAARSYKNLSNGKPWGVVGYMGVFTSMIILGFYAVVAGWCLQYLYASIMAEVQGDANFVKEYFASFSSDAVRPTLWTIAFILLTHVVVVKGVRNGIERASKILMPLLFVLLVVLVVASCSLQGAWKGVEFLLKPDFSKVDPNVMIEVKDDGILDILSNRTSVNSDGILIIDDTENFNVDDNGILNIKGIEQDEDIITPDKPEGEDTIKGEVKDNILNITSTAKLFIEDGILIINDANAIDEGVIKL